MLGKLLKYEWRATARVLLPLYGIFLVASLLLNVAIRFSFSLMSGLIGLAYFGVGVACFVMTLVLLIQRFDGNLLKSEGYLMFTLPVSTTNLILSKLIIALCWGIIGGVIGGIGGLFVIISEDIFEVLPQVVDFIKAALQMATGEHVLLLLLAFVSSIFTFAGFILTIYASLAIGQMPAVAKHRRLAGLVAFILIFIVYANLSEFVSSTFFPKDPATLDVQGMIAFLGPQTVLVAVLSALLFFAVHRILTTKLNLE